MEAVRVCNFPDSHGGLLIQLCARILPGLHVKAGELDRKLLVSGADNVPLLIGLINELQQQYPEAGRHYWSARAWGLLIWQPVLLTLLTTEILQQSLDLGRLGQHCSGTMVAGMTLGAGLLSQKGSCRQQAAGHLREICESALAELGQVIRINPVLARRLLGDRILATLLQLRTLLPDRSHTAVCHLANEWLEAADLSGASALMAFELPHGGADLALDRKGCCQHYRREDGDLCKTCPRQPEAVRINRLQEAWSPDAGAE